MVYGGNRIKDDGTSSDSENDENDNALKNQQADSDSDNASDEGSDGSRETENTVSGASKEPNKPDVTSTKNTKSAKIRDMLIFKEINNDRLPAMLPSTCGLIFPDPNELHIFKIQVIPREGYWNGGTFLFDVVVPEEYNFEPPKVKCTTRIWHPNISENGDVCLSILRSGAIDETGWNPARQLKDVVLGINSLFTDLVNFHDPLNVQAAEMYAKDPTGFETKVQAYIRDNNNAKSYPA